MTAALPLRFRSGSRPRWSAVASAELTLRVRDTNGPLLLACMAAACILLTPPADADYAVITFGGLKPVMSAGTSVLSAGLVLSLLTFPVYALSLGVGCARDRRLGTGTFLVASPVPPISILCGRLVANLLFLAAYSLSMLGLVVAVTASRLRSLPDWTSIAAYLAVVIPSGLCGMLAGVWMDRRLGDRDSAKALLATALWSVLMVSSAIRGPDVFGLHLLRENAPGGRSGSGFAVGIIVANQMAKAPWNATVLTPSFLTARLELIALAFAGFLPVLAWPNLAEALVRPQQRATGGAAAIAIATSAVPRWRTRRIGFIPVAYTVLQHWFQRGSWARPLFAATVICALVAPHSPRISLSLALLIPLAIASAGRISGESRIRQADLATASMWRPSPAVFHSLVLAATSIIPVVPMLAQLTLARGIHILLATVGLTMWLTWAYVILGRPLLGATGYALVWYFESVGDPPAAADLLGFGATAAPSFAAAAAISVALFLIVLRSDSHAVRSSRYV